MNPLRSPRLLLGAIGLGGIALVAGGIALARTMNLAACPLCILQRMLYLLLAGRTQGTGQPVFLGLGLWCERPTTLGRLTLEPHDWAGQLRLDPGGGR